MVPFLLDLIADFVDLLVDSVRIVMSIIRVVHFWVWVEAGSLLNFAEQSLGVVLSHIALVLLLNVFVFKAVVFHVVVEVFVAASIFRHEVV